MIRRMLALVASAAAVGGFAQAPAANYSDIWYSPQEQGWGLTITQHANTNLFAVWYTYDPREPDPSQAGNFKPLWIVMPASRWVTPTQVTGDVYVTTGTPFFQAWGSATATRVGTFTITFSDAGHGSFNYNIAPASGLASNDPAFGLPAFSGTKPIERTAF
jgi:hypothetical protein